MSSSPPSAAQSGLDDTAKLAGLAARGETEPFNQLCQSLEPGLYRQAILLCGDPFHAQDLVQETLIEAWKCLHRYNGKCQLFTWLCAILHNRYRSFARRKRLFSLFRLRSPQEGTDKLCEQLSDDCAWPDQVVHLREQAQQVRACVKALPTKQQQVIYLRFFVDDSLEAIAAALHCSVGTVKSRLFHALEKLRRMPALNEHCKIPPNVHVL